MLWGKGGASTTLAFVIFWLLDIRCIVSRFSVVLIVCHFILLLVTDNHAIHCQMEDDTVRSLRIWWHL